MDCVSWNVNGGGLIRSVDAIHDQFFFQAEDGIRDVAVTGFRRVLFRSISGRVFSGYSKTLEYPEKTLPEILEMMTGRFPEIGRASCRKECRDRDARYD